MEIEVQLHRGSPSRSGAHMDMDVFGIPDWESRAGGLSLSSLDLDLDLPRLQPYQQHYSMTSPIAFSAIDLLILQAR